MTVITTTEVSSLLTEAKLALNAIAYDAPMTEITEDQVAVLRSIAAQSTRIADFVARFVLIGKVA